MGARSRLSRADRAGRRGDPDRRPAVARGEHASSSARWRSSRARVCAGGRTRDRRAGRPAARVSDRRRAAAGSLPAGARATASRDMCGRYTLTSQEGLVEDFEAALDRNAPKNAWWKPRFNVAPTQDAPIVRLREGVRMIEMMRWGLVPFWGGKSGSKPPLMINARVEGRSRQGRVPRRARAAALPRAGRRLLRVAEARRQGEAADVDPSGGRAARLRVRRAVGDARSSRPASCTATRSSPVRRTRSSQPIHDRMPVILDRSAWAAWLDPATSRRRRARDARRPAVGRLARGAGLAVGQRRRSRRPDLHRTDRRARAGLAVLSRPTSRRRWVATHPTARANDANARRAGSARHVE